MAYDKTNWRTGDPITQSRMNKIEEGIANAQRVADGALTAGSTLVTELVSDVNTLNNVVGENDSQGLRRQIGDLAQSIQDANSPNGPGVWAATQIHAATDQRIAATTYDSLDAHFVAIENAARQADTKVSALEGLVGAHSDNLNSALRTGVSQDNLGKRFNDLDTSMTALQTGYGALRDSINAAGQGYNDQEGHPSLSARLDNYEERIEDTETELSNAHQSTALGRTLQNSNAFESIDERFENIETEIVNARSSTTNSDNGVDHVYNTLDARLEAIETSINSNTTNIGQLYDTTVKYTEVKNDFQSTDTNKPISALRGKELRDIIGGTYDPYNTDQEARTTVTSTIASASNTAETNAKNYTDVLLGQGFTTTNTVAKVINDLDISTDTRLDAIETNLTDARVQTGVDDQTNEPIYQYTDLDDRFDTIEGTAAALRTDVNTIANELAMVDTGVIVDNNTRVDQLETDLRTMAVELNMLDGTAIKDTNSRVDAIEYNISHNTSSTTDVDYKRLTATETEDIYTYEVDGEPVTVDANNLEEDETIETIRYKVIEYEDGETITENIPSILEYDENSYLAQLEENEDETGLTIVPITYLVTTTTITDNTTGLTQRITVLETTVDTAETGLSARMTAAETRLGNIDNSSTGALKGLDDRLNAIDGGSALDTTNGTLGARVEAAESAINTLQSTPKSATVIINKERIIYNNEGVPTVYTTDYIENGNNTPITPTSDVDYLFETEVGEEVKYYYWKYIDNNWEKISGDGSNGNSSGYVLTAEEYNSLETKAQNTDYYVLDEDGIHHYRWIPSTVAGETEQIEITQIINTNNIKRYLVAKHDRNNLSGELSTYLDFYEFNYGVEPEIDVEDYSLNRIAEIELPKGGGGGTVSSDTVCTVSYVSAQNQLITQEAASTDGVKISFFYLAYTKQIEDDEILYLSQPCTYTLKKGSRVIDSGNLKARDVLVDENNNPIPLTDEYKRLNATTIDVTKYCKVNEDSDFTLTVTTTGVNPRIRPFHIEVVELGLNSTFDDQAVFNSNTNLRIPLTISSPARNKTIYVKLDENTEDAYEITQVHGEKASSNTTVTIPAEKLTPGLHSIRIYFEEVISGETPVSSNNLLFDIACRDIQNDNVILLSSPYRNQIKQLDQYKTLKIPYYLYIPEGMTTNVVKINGATGRRTTEPGKTGGDEFLFKASVPSTIDNDEMVPFTLTIGCQEEGSEILDPVITVQVKVIANEYTIEPVLDNLVFDFNPIGYINNPQNEADKYWRDENNSAITLSEVPGENFDWDNGGWKYDDAIEAPYFCVKAGSRAQINYSLFQDNMESTGSEFKCIFKAVNVRDPEAIFLTSLDKQTAITTTYSPEKMADDQSLEEGDENTLFSSYFNVKEGRVITYKKGKVSETKLALSVIDDTSIRYSLDDTENAEWMDNPENTLDKSYIMTDSAFNNALEKAKKKIIKKNTTDYATKIINYVKAYDGPEAEDLRALMIGPEEDETSILLGSTIVSGKTVYNASTISDTLAEGATWANFRETSVYTDQIMIELPTLIKNLALTYDTQIITTSQFEKMIVINDHDDEYEQKMVKNIIAQKEDGTTIETQVEISYELDDNNNKIYDKIYLIRQVLERGERSRGLEMRAHRANIHLGSGTLTYPYSEEDIIEFEYNISNPLAQKKTAPILMYEDGVPSAAMLYSTNSNALVQADKGNLIIGSDDCDIHIYRMKFYNKKLNNIEILSNFYADALNPEDMITRYETNIATYTDSSDPDSITPQSIATSCPGVRVIMIEAPNLTGGKNSFIKNSKIRCIYKGEDARPEDNWVALNAYHAGQGTSSDAYGASGRNLDIIFGFDGKDQLIAPKAKNNYRFDPNYKSILITGVDDIDNNIGTADSYIDEILNNINEGKYEGNEDYTTKEELLQEDDFTDDHLHVYLNGTGKVNFNETAVPNNWFNIKLNIASSENTNNALLQKRYDRFLKEIYKTPAQKIGEKNGLDVKNDMEFFNCIVFLKETGSDPSEFPEDKSITPANRPWHFYGIGNIGDSKKTDNTRVNIPGDPFEFCVELSDNGLTNTGFSSGVYWTDSSKTDITYNAQQGYEIKYPVTMAEWTNEDNITHAALIDYEADGGWDSSLEFRYDVSTKDGNTIADTEAEEALAIARQEHNKEVFKNMYEWVVTAPSTGDDSFNNRLRDWFIEESPLYWYLFTERYTMIDSRAKNTFYHYGKIYATAEEVDGATLEECTRVQACASALETAQNSNNEVAIATAQTAYDTAVYVWQHKDCFITPDNNKYYTTVINGITKGAGEINDGYRFDLWDYDNDTALGINNNGQMVFNAGLEDIDRTANAWVYNEATSVFWRRIRNETGNKLRTVYTSRRADCFNAENLIEEFDTWQAEFPENLWRMDFERKYYRPYFKGNNMRYLRDMANGRKKYQRREFERNMCIYIDSKYVLTDAYDPNDFIQFRPTTQQNANQDKMVKITLYSPMYINFSIGNQSNTPGSHVRCMAGETKSFDFFAGITDAQNIQTKIFNASRIKEITGLENYYADDLDFTAASKLRKITLGSDVAVIIDPETQERSTIPYRNNNTKTLVLGAGNPILEILDIRNCIALAPELDLSECISLGTLYATGTPLTKVNLAPSGLMKELYLPATMTALEFNNLYLLDTVQLAGYNNMTSYISYNIFKYNSKNIVFNILPRLTRLELNDINWVIGNIDELEQFKQKQLELGNKMSLAGHIKVTGDYSEIELQDYDNFWNHKITFDVSQGNKQIRWKITYKYDDYFNEDTNQTVTGEVIKTLYIADGKQVPDIWQYWDDEAQQEITILATEDGWTEPPSRTVTRSKTYTFGTYTDNHYNEYSGWKLEDASNPLNAPISANGHIQLYTYFKTTDRVYTINWYLKLEEEENGTTRPIDLIKSSNNVKYGQGYDQIAPTVKDIHEKYARSEILNNTAQVTIEDGIATYEIFDGWERLPTNINPDGSSNNFNIFAKWKTGRIVLTADAFNDIHNLSPEKLVVLSNLSASDRTRYAPSLVTSQTITYQMGHDYNENISPIMNTQRGQNTPIWRFDRNDNPMTINNIMPFSTTNGWTMAFDYSFMPNVNYNNPAISFYPNAAVLAGCYDVIDSNTIVGFALYENKNSQFGPVGPCLGFGDMFNQANQVVSLGSVSSLGERNIVVIRKPNNSSSLFIYTGKNGSASLTATITFEEKVWNKITTEAKLELGKLAHSSLSQLVTRAKGTIYWAKYWEEDLGVGECLELAAWPHENITFGVAANNTNATSRNRLSPENVAITLTAISGSNHGVLNQGAAGKQYGDITGWKTSDARALCNNRIFPGLPTALQSIICKPIVGTKNLEIKKDIGDANIATLTNIDTVRDYIYLPSVANYTTNTDYQQEGNLYPWATSTAGINVYTYNVSGSQFSANVANAAYKNLRFPGQPISLSTLRILNINGQVDNFKDIFNSESSPYGAIVSGDIVIENNQTAYMYVSSNDIISKGLQVEPDSGKFATDGNGGWLKAQEHWTRSINYNAPSYNYYIYIDNETGSVQYSNPSSTGLALNYSFSV